MKTKLPVFALLLLSLSLSACATVDAGAYPASQGSWVMYGHVESVRDHLIHEHGDPGGGAVAGAIIGGVLGTALGGRGFGTFVGATEGAMIGAEANSGGYVGRAFDVFVRFDDGSLRTFMFRDQLPFRPGDYVTWTEQGLFHR
jgi:outer membrane lipoprotein SlyB